MNEENNQTSVEDTQAVNPPETANQDNGNGEPAIDYKVKFSESSREALRLLEETRAKDAEIERLRLLAEQNQNAGNYTNTTDLNFPGFENLTEEEQRNLGAYTDAVTKRALDTVYKDPAIVEAKKSYNERTWLSAFDEVVTEFPELKEAKDDFKSKYYRADNVPTNIKDILKDLSKVYLFDKAREIGAQQAREQAERLDTERTNGGDKTPVASRSLDDWNQMAKDNPAKFAKESAKFKEDLQSGKLQ